MTDAENRELAGYLGILHTSKGWQESTGRYQCSCGVKYRTSEPLTFHLREMRPDFSDPRVVLREMRKRGDFIAFIEHIEGDWSSNDVCKGIPDEYFIPLSYILDTTGLLAKAALDWLRSTPSSTRKSR